MKKLNITIRSLGKNDAPEISYFKNIMIKEGTYFPGRIPTTTTKEKLRLGTQLDSIRDKKRVYRVVVCDDKIIGVAKIFRNGGFAKHIGTLTILILPEFRSQGIGTKLLRDTLRSAKRDIGLKTVRLFVRKENEKAIGLYKKLGFIDYGYLPAGIYVNRRYYDCILMYKNL